MKKWYQSKTVWVNAITVLVGTLGYVVGNSVIQDYPSAIAALVVFQGGLNVLLRFVTGKSLG
jgi:hypothetical protein